MRVWLALALTGLMGTSAEAQSTAGLRAGVAAPAVRDAEQNGDCLVANEPFGFHISGRVLPYAPLASAVLPGAGQAMLGNNRGIAYAAVELLTWVQYFQDRRDQATQERARLSHDAHVARAHFSSNPPDGPWAYYEQMRDFAESGVYSKSTAGVIPETDLSTYNGFEWDVLKRAHPDSLEALALYEQIAIHPDFQWSWRNAGLQWDLFKRTTGLRNDANRRRNRDLEIVLANHFLSMIDAFTTFRLRAEPTADGGASLGVNFHW